MHHRSHVIESNIAPPTHPASTLTPLHVAAAVPGRLGSIVAVPTTAHAKSRPSTGADAVRDYPRACVVVYGSAERLQCGSTQHFYHHHSATTTTNRAVRTAGLGPTCSATFFQHWIRARIPSSACSRKKNNGIPFSSFLLAALGSRIGDATKSPSRDPRP